MNNLLSINLPKKKKQKHIDGQRSFKSTSYKFRNLQQTVVYVGQRTFVTSLYIIGKGYYSLRTSANYFDGKIPLRKSRSITFVWCWAKRAVWGILTRSTRIAIWCRNSDFTRVSERRGKTTCIRFAHVEQE